VVSDTASREHRVEAALAEMTAEWAAFKLVLKSHKLTGVQLITGICWLCVLVVSVIGACFTVGRVGSSAEDTRALIDAHSVRTHAMIGTARFFA
jgi:hypothetical protein